MTLTNKIKSLVQLLLVDFSLAIRILVKRYTKNSWLSKKEIKEPFKGVIFNFDFNLSPMVKYMYTGSYEIETYLALKKFLSKGDTFVDVGGNIGYITALGAGIVGKTGQVHSFEPIKKYFSLLNNVAKDNPEYKIVANNYAISENEGTAKITLNNSGNIGNNSMVSNSMKDEEKGIEEEIKTINLTKYLTDNNLNPSLIKIDTEGYELTVLNSLKDFIIKSTNKPVIYCEVTPDAYVHFGKSINDLTNFLSEINYGSYYMNDLNNKLNTSNISKRVDLVFKPL